MFFLLFFLLFFLKLMMKILRVRLVLLWCKSRYFWARSLLIPERSDVFCLEDHDPISRAQLIMRLACISFGPNMAAALRVSRAERELWRSDWLTLLVRSTAWTPREITAVIWMLLLLLFIMTIIETMRRDKFVYTMYLCVHRKHGCKKVLFLFCLTVHALYKCLVLLFTGIPAV